MKTFKKVSSVICLSALLILMCFNLYGCDSVVWMHYNNNGGEWTESFMEREGMDTNTTKWNRGINITYFDIAVERSPNADDITKTGYEFDGWYYDSELTILFCNADRTTTEDAKTYWTEWFNSSDHTGIQLYAKWVEK